MNTLSIAVRLVLGVGPAPAADAEVFQTDIFVWVMDTGTQIGDFHLIKLTPEGQELWRARFGQSLAVGVDPHDGSVWAPELNDNLGNSDQVVKLNVNGFLVRRVQGYRTSKITVDPNNGSVWVGLPNESQIVKLDSDGAEILSVPGFDAPASIVVDPRDSNVWIADGGGAAGRKVVKVDSNGHELFRRSTTGFFSDAPQQIAVDPRDGSVWYTGSFSRRVFKISTDGTELKQVRGFDLPVSVAVDPIDGSVWVADFSVTTPGAVVKLDQNGNELLRVSLGLPPQVAFVHPEDGSVWVGVKGALVHLSSAGQVLETLPIVNLPKAIVIARVVAVAAPTPSPSPSPTGPPTAIELISFKAKANDDGSATLKWRTATEVDNAGFNIYRKRKCGSYTQINNTLIPAKGNSTAGASYSYEDTPGIGTFYYKLEDVDSSGVSTMHEPVRVKVNK